MDSALNKSVTGGAKRGELPFKVVDEIEGANLLSSDNNIVIDTPACPTQEDFQILSSRCDLLILPSIPDTLSLEALIQVVNYLNNLNRGSFDVK